MTGGGRGRAPDILGGMTDAPAFFRAIEAEPDDDTPRLVYADWLDENAASDADRAGRRTGGSAIENLGRHHDGRRLRDFN